MLGRLFVTEDYQARGTPVVLLGYDLWQRVFGGAPTIGGRVIQIDSRQRTVVGIMPKGFSFPKGAELWLPQ
jgi:putative ABC transport system permease protein